MAKKQSLWLAAVSVVGLAAAVLLWPIVRPETADSAGGDADVDAVAQGATRVDQTLSGRRISLLHQ